MRGLDQLRVYVYRNPEPRAVLRKRNKWFRKIAEAHLVLWWIPTGHIPSVREAEERMRFLRRNGPHTGRLHVQTALFASHERARRRRQRRLALPGLERGDFPHPASGARDNWALEGGALKDLWRLARNFLRRRRARPLHTPIPSSDLPDLLLGAGVLELLLDPRRWIHSRVERVELLDASTQERTVSIEFDRPVELERSTGTIDALPLAVVRKQGPDVDIHTEANVPVAALPRAETEFVAWSVVAAAAQAAAPGAPTELDRALLRALRRIVTAVPEDARATLDDLFGGTNPMRAALERSEIFQAVAMTLADGSLVLTAAGEVPPGRNLLRMRYRETIQPTSGGLGRWTGWSPTPLVLSIPGASDGRSYRFEMIAPPALQIVEASMWSGPSQASSTDYTTGGGSEARLHFDAEADDPPTHVWVWLGARRRGVLRGCLASTGTHVLLLIGGLWHLARGETPPNLSLAALALAGATSLAASHEPHDFLAGRLLAGPRRCAALSGVLSLTATVGTLFAAPLEVVRTVWGVLVLAALISFAAVAVAYRSAASPAAPGRRRRGRDELGASRGRPARLPPDTGFFVGRSAETPIPHAALGVVPDASTGGFREPQTARG